MLSPQFFLDQRPEFLAQKISAFPLEFADQIGDGQFGMDADQQVNMVVFAVKLEQLAIHLGTGFGKQLVEPGQQDGGEYFPPVFGDEHEMDLVLENTGASGAPLMCKVFFHRLDLSLSAILLMSNCFTRIGLE